MYAFTSNFIGLQNGEKTEFTTPLIYFQNETDIIDWNFTDYREFTNDTFQDYPEIPDYIKITSIFFCVFIMLLGVIGNVMVPIVILKTKDMRNSTNIFLVNLSIADLLVLLVCTPTVLVEVNSKPETWVLGRELCLAVPFVELTVAHASVLTILAISFERYYAICEPLRAGYVCTKTRATLICCLAWFFAAVFTSPILKIVDYTYSPEKDANTCLTEADGIWPIIFFLSTITIFFFLPLIILIILYTIIAINLINAAKTVGRILDPFNVRARKQVVLMLGTVVLSFFLCLMPFRLFILWIITSNVNFTSMNIYYNLLYFSRCMLYLNSAINPILYNLMSSKFRKGFLKVCQVKKPAKNLTRFRKRTGTFNTVTLSSSCTTSSSLSRTTNSLRQLFSNRNSFEKTSCENNSDLLKKLQRKFWRQHSEPINNGGQETKMADINRFVSVDNVFASDLNAERDSDIIHLTLRRKILIKNTRRHSLEVFVEDLKLKKIVNNKNDSHVSFV